MLSLDSFQQMSFLDILGLTFEPSYIYIYSFFFGLNRNGSPTIHPGLPYPQVYSIHLPLALQTSETRNSLETRTFPGRPPSRAFHWPRPTASMGLRGLPQITNSKVSVCISPKATEKTVVYPQRRHRRCPNSPSGTGSSDCNPFELFT